MDHSAAPAPYPYGQPSGYPPYPYPYPPANAAWPPGFDPAMLPYPDPRMYAGGVPGYFDPMAVRPPPSAADFYAAAAVSLPSCPHVSSTQSPRAKLILELYQIFCQLVSLNSWPGCQVHWHALYVFVQLPHTSNLLNDACLPA